jgi:hypothetical protein
MKVAIILPSRGLMFSKTAEEILHNVKDVPHKFFFAHKLPIPDCFEKPTNRALLDEEVTHLWFVEDDMILPPDILKQMLDMDVAAVTADYPTTDYGGGAVFKVKGRIIFCGTGCTLVKREVFDELKSPYWRTDICWNVKNYGDFIKLIAVPRGENTLTGYGLHDVNFAMNLYRRDIPIHDVGTTIGQRKLKALGKAGSNDGAHQIDEWTKIKKDDLLEKIQKWPIEARGNLLTVLIGDKELLVSQDHAKKLIKSGKATKPPRRAIVVDDSEIL